MSGAESEPTPVLILAAHADDETLGMGGTLCRHIARGDAVHWLIMTRVWSPKWSPSAVEARQADVQRVAESYGFHSVTQWPYGDNRLDGVSTNELQERLIAYLDGLRPEILYVPWRDDCNFEHRIAFELAEMSTKPGYTPYLRAIYGYEIPSGTEWTLDRPALKPTRYVDIESTLERKLEIAGLYSTEMRSTPHSRSEAYLRALARVRGAECGRAAAEGFRVLREVCDL